MKNAGNCSERDQGNGRRDRRLRRSAVAISTIFQGDCRYSGSLGQSRGGTSDGTTGIPAGWSRHEGSTGHRMALDHYGGDPTNKQYYAVDHDHSDQAEVLTTGEKQGRSFRRGGIRPAKHTACRSATMARAATSVSLASLPAADLAIRRRAPVKRAADLRHQVKFRRGKANPQVQSHQQIFWKDGGVSQHTDQ